MKNDFRLISIYIGSFDCLKGQTVNFCSDYHTTARVDAEGSLLLEVKEKDVLPDNFFALNEGNDGNGCVKSVSAIIGQNGTGKTTLARLLCNLPVSDERKPEWKTVLVYEEGGELKCYPTFQPVKAKLITVSGARRSIPTKRDPSTPFPYKLFYYSPHFTTEQFDVYTTGSHVDKGTGDDGDVKDISTTRLLLYPDGNSELLPVVGAKQASIFDADEKIRLFEFIAEYNAKGKKLVGKFDMPMPESVSIGIHNDGFRLAQYDIRANAERAPIVKEAVQKHTKIQLPPQALIYPVDKYLKEVGDFFDEYWKASGQYSLVVNVFMSYVARYIQDSGIFSATFPQEKLREGFLAGFKGFIDGGGWAEEEKIKEFLTHCPPELPIGQNEDKSGSGVNPMLELIEILQELCRASAEQSSSSAPTVRIIEDVVYCKLGEQELLEKICRLVWLHGFTRVLSPYLKFDVFPHMSSGEMSFLTLFARLYHFIKETEMGKNIIVFLDEAETTLHPEWQQQLVAYCIRFFEVFLPDRNYQLIFSSHSPMLLSDIPVGNAVFLKRRYEDEEKHTGVYSESVSVLKPSLGYTNTFAANIFDLYRNSFFLEDKGIVGMFAQEKLNRIMAKAKRIIQGNRDQVGPDAKKEITVEEKMEDGDWATLELIGDPLAKRYFSSIEAILKGIRK